jgi:hypothetical protein
VTTLFSDDELFTGDPIYPDTVQVCPPSIIASLTRSQREERVQHLINQAHDIVDSAWELADGRMRAAWCVLYSGGNDSTVLAHLMRGRVDYAVHANTTIGIEATRQFVRDTCEAWGLELLERTAPQSYRDLVLERGFPGPGMHYKMYQRLKERVLDEVRRELVTDSRRQRVLFIAGRRRSESARRKSIPLHEVDGSAIWATPPGHVDQVGPQHLSAYDRRRSGQLSLREAAHVWRVPMWRLCKTGRARRIAVLVPRRRCGH